MTSGGIVLPFILEHYAQKGGSTMSEKLKVALAYLDKAAAILRIVANAGKAVLTLIEG